MKLEELVIKLKEISKTKKKVLVTGVFDGLHQAHLEFLKQAKASGDYLIVGVESDSRVTQMKGPNRPTNRQESRLAAIKKSGLANFVFILPEKFGTKEEHENLIEKIRPDILAVSSHSLHLEAKKKILNKYGGDVKIVMKHDPGISTTILLNQQKKA